jgi:hypothetical protein
MTQSQRSRWRNPRLALGLAVTALAVWWSFRGVDLRALGAALAGADLRVAVPGSLACYAASLWVRALRWRHLAAAVGELPHGVAYRATAIRFMGNNLFPFRLGELAGAWFAARDAGGSAAAWFGTIVLERAFELPLAVRGIAFVPILGVAALRLWPAPFVAIARGVATALLPAGLAARALGLVEHVVAGLSGIRDARGLALVIWHTVLQWGVAATLPFYLAQRAFAVSLGSFAEDYIAALETMVGVGVAVALPQAPGFLGVYHFACREVLSALGVPAETALGVGTLAHALFWLSITGLGLLALRGSRGSLAEAVRPVTAQKAP